MTRMTISRVSVRVLSTSSMESWMYSDESKGMPAFIPAGSSAWMPGIASRTRLITSSVLAVGSTQMPMKTAVSPLKRTSWS